MLSGPTAPLAESTPNCYIKQCGTRAGLDEPIGQSCWRRIRARSPTGFWGPRRPSCDPEEGTSELSAGGGGAADDVAGKARKRMERGRARPRPPSLQRRRSQQLWPLLSKATGSFFKGSPGQPALKCTQQRCLEARAGFVVWMTHFWRARTVSGLSQIGTALSSEGCGVPASPPTLWLRTPPALPSWSVHFRGGEGL